MAAGGHGRILNSNDEGWDDALEAITVEADLAERRLRELLERRKQGGVPFHSSFTHFDPHGDGEVTEQAFLSGLRRLDIDLSNKTAAALFMSRLLRNDRGNIGVEQFIMFAEGTVADFDGRYHPSGAPQATTRSTVRPLSGGSAANARLAARQEVKAGGTPRVVGAFGAETWHAEDLGAGDGPFRALPGQRQFMRETVTGRAERDSRAGALGRGKPTPEEEAAIEAAVMGAATANLSRINEEKRRAAAAKARTKRQAARRRRAARREAETGGARELQWEAIGSYREGAAMHVNRLPAKLPANRRGGRHDPAPLRTAAAAGAGSATAHNDGFRQQYLSSVAPPGGVKPTDQVQELLERRERQRRHRNWLKRNEPREHRLRRAAQQTARRAAYGAPSPYTVGSKRGSRRRQRPGEPLPPVQGRAGSVGSAAMVPFDHSTGSGLFHTGGASLGGLRQDGDEFGRGSVWFTAEERAEAVAQAPSLVDGVAQEAAMIVAGQGDANAVDRQAVEEAVPSLGPVAAQVKEVDYAVHWYDDDTSMLYTVLRGPAMEVAPDGAVDARASQEGLGVDSVYASGRPVDLLVLPDLFDDMTGLARTLAPLMAGLPGSRALIVHFPGMAGTTWNEFPADLVLSQADWPHGGGNVLVDSSRIPRALARRIEHATGQPLPPGQVQSDSEDEEVEPEPVWQRRVEAATPRSQGGGGGDEEDQEEDEDRFDDDEEGRDQVDATLPSFPGTSHGRRQRRAGASQTLAEDATEASPARRRRRYLTTDFLALCVRSLVRDLRQRKQWGPTRPQDARTEPIERKRGRVGRDLVILGSGLGAHVGTVFATQFCCRKTPRKGMLPFGGKQDRILASSLRAVVLVSGFAHLAKQLRSVLEVVADSHGPLATMAGLPSDPVAPGGQVDGDVSGSATLKRATLTRQLDSRRSGRDAAPRSPSRASKALALSSTSPVQSRPGSRSNSRSGSRQGSRSASRQQSRAGSPQTGRSRRGSLGSQVSAGPLVTRGGSRAVEQIDLHDPFAAADFEADEERRELVSRNTISRSSHVGRNDFAKQDTLRHMDPRERRFRHRLGIGRRRTLYNQHFGDEQTLRLGDAGQARGRSMTRGSQRRRSRSRSPTRRAHGAGSVTSASEVSDHGATTGHDTAGGQSSAAAAGGDGRRRRKRSPVRSSNPKKNWNLRNKYSRFGNGGVEGATGGVLANTRGRGQPVRELAVHHMRDLLLGRSFVKRLGERLAVEEMLRRNQPLAMADPFLDLGIAALARGLARSPDMRTGFKAMRVPVLLLAGTEDVFVTPLTSQHMARARSLEGGGDGTCNGADSGGSTFAHWLERGGKPLSRKDQKPFLDKKPSQAEAAALARRAARRDATSRNLFTMDMLGEAEGDEFVNFEGGEASGDDADDLDLYAMPTAADANPEPASDDDDDDDPSAFLASMTQSRQQRELRLQKRAGTFRNACPTHVVWLQSGHNVIQEREAFFLRVLGSVLTGRDLSKPGSALPGSAAASEEARARLAVTDAPRAGGGSVGGFGLALPGSLQSPSRTGGGDGRPAGEGFTVPAGGWAGAGAPLAYEPGMTPLATMSPGGGAGGGFPAYADPGERQDDDEADAAMVAELEARGLPTHGSKDECITRLEEALAKDLEEIHQSMAANRQSAEETLRRRARAQLEEQERDREAKRRQAELEASGEAALLLKERRRREDAAIAAREGKDMTAEDALSRAMEDQLARQEAVERRRRAAEREAAELRARLDAMPELERQQALARARALEKAAESKNDDETRMLVARHRAEMKLQETLGSGGDQAEDRRFGLLASSAPTIVAGSRRLVESVTELRGMRRTAVRRWQVAAERGGRAKENHLARRRELRGLDKAIKLTCMDRDGIIKALEAEGLDPSQSAEVQATQAELYELEQYRLKVQAKLSELEKQMAKSQAVGADVTASAELIVMVSRRREEQLRRMRVKVARSVRELREQRVEARRQQETSTADADAEGARAQRLIDRRDELASELARARSCRNKMIDTQVWQRGVKQRVRCADLIRFLDGELQKLQEKLDAHEEAIRDARRRADEAEVLLETTGEDVTRLTAALRDVVDACRGAPASTSGSLRDEGKAQRLEALADGGGAMADMAVRDSSGRLLTRRDEALQWLSDFQAERREIDSYLDEVAESGVDLADIGAAHCLVARAIPLPAPLPRELLDAPRANQASAFTAITGMEDSIGAPGSTRDAARVLLDGDRQPARTRASDVLAPGVALLGDYELPPNATDSAVIGGDGEPEGKEEGGGDGSSGGEEPLDSAGLGPALPRQPAAAPGNEASALVPLQDAAPSQALVVRQTGSPRRLGVDLGNTEAFVVAKVGRQGEGMAIRTLMEHCRRAVVCRWLAASERSEEEKHWVALDQLLHPSMYTHATQEDRRLMGIDPGYKLPKGATLEIVRHLERLPASPMLALARIDEPEHIQWHKLLAKFSHGAGESEERARDLDSGARAAAQAAVARGFVARTKHPAHRSLEEAEWVCYDSVLRPYLYAERFRALGPVRPRPGSAAGDALEAGSRPGSAYSAGGFSHHAGTPTAGSHGVHDYPTVPEHEAGDSDDEGAASTAQASSGAVSHASGGVLGFMKRLMTFRRLQSAEATAALGKLDMGAVEKAQAADKAGRGNINRATAYIMASTGMNALDAERRLHLVRKLPPSRCPFSREELQRLLVARAAELETPLERRAQMLLRAYGSDGGAWIYRAAAAAPTGVAQNVSDVPDLFDAVALRIADEGGVDYTPELAICDADGDRSNVAATALQAAQATVLVRSTYAEEVLRVERAPMMAGETVDFVFEVPGSRADCAGFGPRKWGDPVAALGKKAGGLRAAVTRLVPGPGGRPYSSASEHASSSPPQPEGFGRPPTGLQVVGGAGAPIRNLGTAGSARLHQGGGGEVDAAEARHLFAPGSAVDVPGFGIQPVDAGPGMPPLPTSPPPGGPLLNADDVLLRPRTAKSAITEGARPSSRGSSVAAFSKRVESNRFVNRRVPGQVLRPMEKDPERLETHPLDHHASQDPLMETFTGGAASRRIHPGARPRADLRGAGGGGGGGSKPPTPGPAVELGAGLSRVEGLPTTAPLHGHRAPSHGGRFVGGDDLDDGSVNVAMASQVPNHMAPWQRPDSSGAAQAAAMGMEAGMGAAAPHLLGDGAAEEDKALDAIGLGIIRWSKPAQQPMLSDVMQIMDVARISARPEASGLTTRRSRFSHAGGASAPNSRPGTSAGAGSEGGQRPGTAGGDSVVTSNTTPTLLSGLRDPEKERRRQQTLDDDEPGGLGGKPASDNRVGRGAEAMSDLSTDTEMREMKSDDSRSEGDFEGEGDGGGDDSDDEDGRQAMRRRAMLMAGKWHPGDGLRTHGRHRRGKRGAAQQQKARRTKFERECGVRGVEPVAIDLTITITFTGGFGANASGYRAGKLQAALYREPYVPPAPASDGPTGSLAPGQGHILPAGLIGGSLENGRSGVATPGGLLGGLVGADRTLASAAGFRRPPGTADSQQQQQFGGSPLVRPRMGSAGAPATAHAQFRHSGTPSASPEQRPFTGASAGVHIDGRQPTAGGHQSGRPSPRTHLDAQRFGGGPLPEPLELLEAERGASASSSWGRGGTLAVGSSGGGPGRPLTAGDSAAAQGPVGVPPISLSVNDTARLLLPGNLCMRPGLRRRGEEEAFPPVPEEWGVDEVDEAEAGDDGDDGLDVDAADDLAFGQTVQSLFGETGRRGYGSTRNASSNRFGSLMAVEEGALQPLDEALTVRQRRRGERLLPELPSVSVQPTPLGLPRALYRGPPVDISGADVGGVSLRGDSRMLRAEQSKNLPQDWRQIQPPLARGIPRIPGVPEDQTAATMRVPVGYASWDDSQVSSTRTVGRLTIRHEPAHGPLTPGRYSLSIKGVTPGQYSVTAVCRLAYPARDVIEGAVRHTARVVRRIPKCRAEVDDTSASYALGCRKRHLVRDMIRRTETALSGSSAQTGRLRDALERGYITRADFVETQEEADFFRTEQRRQQGKVPEAESTDEEASSDEDEELRAAKAEVRRATAALIEHRKQGQRLHISAHVRREVVRKLTALEDHFAGMVRALTVRREELRRITEGLTALREARAEREAELANLMAFVRMQRRHIPECVRAARLLPVAEMLDPDSADEASDGGGDGDEGSEVPDGGSDGGGGEGAGAGKEEGDAAAQLRRRKRRDWRHQHEPTADAIEAPCSSVAVHPLDTDHVRLGPGIFKYLRRVEEERALRRGADTPAARVRAKAHGELTPEEALWMSMDMVLHPDEYEGMDVDGEEEAALDKLVAAALRDEALVEPAQEGGPAATGGAEGKEEQGGAAASGAGAADTALVAAPSGGGQVTTLPPSAATDQAAQAAFIAREAAIVDAGGPATSGAAGIKAKAAERSADVRQAARAAMPGAAAALAEAPPVDSPSRAADRTSTRPVDLARTMYGTGDTRDGGRGVAVVVGEGAMHDPQLARERVGSEPARGAEGGDHVIGEDGQVGGAAPIAIDTSAGRSVGGGGGSTVGGASRASGRFTASTHSLRDKASKLQLLQKVDWGDGPLPTCPYSRAELQRIVTIPLQQLTRVEREIRTLFTHFHDRPPPAHMRNPGTAALQTLGNNSAAAGTTGDWVAKGANEGEQVALERRAVLDAGGDPNAVESAEQVRLLRQQRGVRSAEGALLELARNRWHQGRVEYHGTSSLFARAFNAVPIPQGGAPRKLRDLVKLHAAELQRRWDEHGGKQLVSATGGSAAGQRGSGRADGGGSAAASVAGGGGAGAGGAGDDAGTVVTAKSRRSRRTNKSRRTGATGGLGGTGTVAAFDAVMTGDVDQRARDLLAELDRACATSQPRMDTAVLHGSEQRFATAVLRQELERELDRTLLLQVLEREHVEAALLQEQAEIRAQDAAAAAAAEEERLRVERDEVLRKIQEDEETRLAAVELDLQRMQDDMDEQEAKGGGGNDALARRARRAETAAAMQEHQDGLTAAQQEKLARANKAAAEGETQHDRDAEQMDNALGADFDEAQHDAVENDAIAELGGLAMWGAPDQPLSPRAEGERTAGKQRSEIEARDAQLMQAQKERRRVRGQTGGGLPAGETATSMLKKRQQQAAMGTKPLGDIKNPIGWKPHVNVDTVKSRLRELDGELDRMQALQPSVEQLLEQARAAEQEAGMGSQDDGDSPYAFLAVRRRMAPVYVESTIALSHKRGAPARMTLEDAVFDLSLESQDLKNRLRLVDLDRELFFAHNTTSHVVTTTALHGVPQQAFRDDAILALEREANRIVAHQVAVGVVDDILDWMLEGWHFGERESQYHVAGRVKALGDKPLRPYQALSAAARLYSLQGPAAQARAWDAARGFDPLEGGDPGANAKAVARLRRLDPNGDQHMVLLHPRALLSAAAAEAAGVVQMADAEEPPPAADAKGVPLFRDGGAREAIRLGLLHPLRRAASGGGIGPGGMQPALEDAAAVEDAIVVPADAKVITGPDGARMALVALPDGPDGEADDDTAAPDRGYTPGTIDLFQEGQVRRPRGHQLVYLHELQPDPHGVEAQLAAAPGGLQQFRGHIVQLCEPGSAAALVAGAANSTSGLPGGDRRMAVESRMGIMQAEVRARDSIRRAVEAHREAAHIADETERTLRYSMFLFVLRYFRGMSQLGRQRDLYAGGNEAALLTGQAREAPKTKERARMDAAEEARDRRAAAMQMAEEKAQLGFDAKAKRTNAAAEKERQRRLAENRLRLAKRVGATQLQRIFQGHVARRHVAQMLQAKQSLEILRKQREFNAAVFLQSCFRGYLVRRWAREERSKLAAAAREARRRQEEEERRQAASFGGQAKAVGKAALAYLRGLAAAKAEHAARKERDTVPRRDLHEEDGGMGEFERRATRHVHEKARGNDGDFFKMNTEDMVAQSSQGHASAAAAAASGRGAGAGKSKGGRGMQARRLRAAAAFAQNAPG